MEHIDRAKLYTDLNYRFQYVSKFVGFGEEDIAAIKGAAPLVAPLVSTIVDAVYDKLFSFDITKAHFLKRNEGYEGKCPLSTGAMTKEDGQIKYRMSMLNRYLVKLVTAEYDEKFIKYLDYVGRIHTTKAGKKSINVEYIHCNALFGYVEDIIVNAVMGMDLDNETKTKTLRAFNKLLWIQNDLFARHYLSDGNDVTGEGDKSTGKDQLCGKQVSSMVVGGVVGGLIVAAAATLLRR